MMDQFSENNWKMNLETNKNKPARKGNNYMSDTMNREYNKKIESALIATGKLVAAKEGQPAPSVPELEVLFDKLLQAIDKEDMKGQVRASKELIASLIKWQIEKL
jgi:hypothetical protein